MTKTSIIERLNSLSIGNNKIYALRGFHHYISLDDINGNHLIDDEFLFWINDQSVVNVVPKILKKLDGSNYFCYYDELYMFKSVINSIFEDFEYSITIIDYNIYDLFYPSNKEIDINVFAKLEKFSDDNYNCQKVYSGYHLGKDVSMVMYNDLEISRIFDVISIFDDTIINFEQSGEQCDEFRLSSEESREEFNENLYHILRNSNVVVNVLSSTSKQLDFSQKRSISILSRLGYQVKCFLPKIIRTVVSEDVYLEILRRRNPNYSFKNLKLYSNPGLSGDLEEVSQSVIIDDIVENAVKSQTGKPFNDIFVTAPTGSGKSVMFQIPAIYLAESSLKCITIVVSPLISLMNDQVKNIRDLTDQACAMNSDYTPIEKENIRQSIMNGSKSILYLSPESLLSNSDIKGLIGERKIGLMIIDEAHTVATWGKSFRPDYWYLGDYIKYLRTKSGYRFPIATFSATVTYGGTDDMHFDLIESLNMHTNNSKYIGQVRRDDIKFDVRRCSKINDYKKEKDDAVLKSLNRFISKKEKTIAYFPFVSMINNTYNGLDNKLKAGIYHGQIFYKGAKDEAVTNFQKGKTCLVLATKAFGMGIDIDDIKNVYHFAPTGNLCDYVQEIGRAARKPGLIGFAITDYYKEDYRYIKQLHGMSRIRDEHIKAVLGKIKQTYNIKRKRNFTVSPDDFSFVFQRNADSMSGVDAQLKTTLLMIQKDFEFDKNLNYKPLVFKPRSMFTIGYVLIKDEDYEKLTRTKFARYFKIYYSKEDYLSILNNGKTTITIIGNIYKVDFKSLWEENFSDLSFGDFKRKFYEGELSGLEFSSSFIPEYLLSVLTEQGNVSDAAKKLVEILNDCKDIFNNLYQANKHFSYQDFSELLITKFTFIRKDESLILAENMINILNQFSTNDFNNKNVVDYNDQTGKMSLKSYAIVDKKIRGLISVILSQYDRVAEKPKKVHIIHLNKKDTYGKKIMDEPKLWVAQLFELFGLATYEITTGERPEFFIRVNSISAIEKVINSPSYSSKMVKLVNDRHNDSIKKMKHFFENLDDDNSRWDYIEKYFSGLLDEE